MHSSSQYIYIYICVYIRKEAHSNLRRSSGDYSLNLMDLAGVTQVCFYVQYYGRRQSRLNTLSVYVMDRCNPPTDCSRELCGKATPIKSR